MRLFDEFTKLIVFLVMTSYFWVLYEGIKLARQYPEVFDPVSIMATAAISVTIGFYCWKAKNQNIIEMTKEGFRVDGEGYITFASDTTEESEGTNFPLQEERY